jgi:hypothetical protein
MVSISQEEEPGILLRLSDETGLSPALLARAIIDRHYQRQDGSSILHWFYFLSYTSLNLFIIVRTCKTSCIIFHEKYISH